jgi:pyruvate dehydrogenase E2 component (dihydrolipoamide acetyltransferase)
MAELLRVPEVAAGATEAILSEWLVTEGSSFRAGDPIAVLETDKAQVEIEAESDSFILRSLVRGGSQVEVGSPMALIGTEAELSADLDALLVELGASAVAATPAPPRREIPETEPEANTAAPASDQGPAAPRAPSIPVTAPGGRRFVSPIARKLLREAGLEVDGLRGSGPDGRVVRRDVEAAIAAGLVEPPAAAPTPPPAPSPTAGPARPVGGGFHDEPHSRLRRAVATRLTQSKRTVPHFYLKRTAGLDALLALRAEVNAQVPVKISVNDFVIRAVAVAHVAVPEANVIWTDDAMRRFDTVDISVAVASERGLVTPVLRGVERSSLSGISTAVREFVALANTGKLQQRDLEGGSISVTNLGMYGVEEFAAIINPPQSAILAVGAARPVPVVVDGEVVVRTAMTLVLSVDHRAIDGALAARWMDALVGALENPLRLLV